MNSLLGKIRGTARVSFVRDTVTLQAGSVISILLSVAASVAFARILQPEKYGIYSLVFSLASFIFLFANLGTIQATETLLSEAYAERDDEKMKAVLTYFIKVTLSIFLLIGLFGLFLSPILSELLYKSRAVGSLARVILLAEILTVFISLATITLQVLRRIRYLTMVENLTKFLKSSLPIIAVLLGLGLSGLVVGYLLATIIAVILSLWIYFRLIKEYDYLPSFREIFAHFKNVSIKKYFTFGIQIAVSKNIAGLFFLMPVLMLGVFAPVKEVGFFKIAFSYISIPLVLLTPISRLLAVQLPKSKILGVKYLKEHFIKVSLYSGLISVVLVLPFMAAASFLVTFFYGEEYIPSIRLIYYLSGYVALIGFGIGLGPVFRALDKMKVVIAVNVSVLLVGFIAGYFLINSFGPAGCCILVSLLAMASNFTLLALAVRIINKE